MTAPDGSVTDLGNVGGSTGTTAWVPYTGNGTYTVSVSAYGVDEEGDPEVLDTDEAEPTKEKSAGAEAHAMDEAPAEAQPAEEQPAEEETAVEDAPPAAETTPTTPELPPCPPAEPAPAPSDGDSAGDAAGHEVAPAQTPAPSDCVPAG